MYVTALCVPWEVFRHAIFNLSNPSRRVTPLQKFMLEFNFLNQSMYRKKAKCIKVFYTCMHTPMPAPHVPAYLHPHACPHPKERQKVLNVWMLIYPGISRKCQILRNDPACGLHLEAWQSLGFRGLKGLLWHRFVQKMKTIWSRYCFEQFKDI